MGIQKWHNMAYIVLVLKFTIDYYSLVGFEQVKYFIWVNVANFDIFCVFLPLISLNMNIFRTLDTENRSINDTENDTIWPV